MTPAETKATVQKANEGLGAISSTFQRLIPLRAISAIFAEANLNLAPVEANLRGDKGEMHVEVGPQVWFRMTWERRDSGRYEINAYLTSAFDDYREPYTVVMDKGQRRKAKNLLGKLLCALTSNHFFNGKAEAFGQIQNCIKTANLDFYEFEDRTAAGHVNEDQGRFTVSVSNGLFVTVTWFRMEVTGRYEIVAYAS